MTQQQEYLVINTTYDVKYKWAAGPYLQKFLESLKEGKIYANKCPKCGRMLLPPRVLCGRCHVRMGDFIELSTKGTLLSYNLVVDPVYDSATGQMREVPYATGTVVLDGGPDCSFFHYLEEKDVTKLKPGLRMEVVFKPKSERRGLISDVLHLKVIEK